MLPTWSRWVCDVMTTLTLSAENPTFLQLLVDHVGTLLAGLEEVAEARCPIGLAVAVGDRDVVPGVEHHQALRVVDDPHADRDGDVALLFLRNRGDQASDREWTEHPAGRPVDTFYRLRRCHCRAGQHGHAHQSGSNPCFLHDWSLLTEMGLDALTCTGSSLSEPLITRPLPGSGLPKSSRTTLCTCACLLDELQLPVARPNIWRPPCHRSQGYGKERPLVKHDWPGRHLCRTKSQL